MISPRISPSPAIQTFEWRPQELVGHPTCEASTQTQWGWGGVPITLLLLLQVCFISTLLQERVEVIPVGQVMYVHYVLNHHHLKGRSPRSRNRGRSTILWGKALKPRAAVWKAELLARGGSVHSRILPRDPAKTMRSLSSALERH